MMPALEQNKKIAEEKIKEKIEERKKKTEEKKRLKVTKIRKRKIHQMFTKVLLFNYPQRLRKQACVW